MEFDVIKQGVLSMSPLQHLLNLIVERNEVPEEKKE
jgi:hypothetical protein